MSAPDTTAAGDVAARELAARSFWEGNEHAPDYAAADRLGLRGLDRYIFSLGWYSRRDWAALTWLLSRDRAPFIAGRRAARAYQRALATVTP